VLKLSFFISFIFLIDGISLAVMVKSEVDEIYSNDTGFDKVKWVKRIFK